MEVLFRLLALKSHEEGWKRKVPVEKMFLSESSEVPCPVRTRPGDEDDQPRRIKERMSALIDSQERWTQRVRGKDTEALTVGGKLAKAGVIDLQGSTPLTASDPPEKPKRTTKLARETEKNKGSWFP
ncbi:MAG: hypothetical protein GY696_08115, partial [Gammaproteobacteria bacterium]|nr:hypothetical protein [Gammaproteobacteria bacterium]